MTNKPTTLSAAVRGILGALSEHTSRYEVGVYLPGGKNNTPADFPTWWADRKVGREVPEENFIFDGPYKACLFDAYEQFGTMVDEIADDRFSVVEVVGNAAKVEADLVWDQLDSMVGASIDLEIDKAWTITMNQIGDYGSVVVYLVRMR